MDNPDVRLPLAVTMGEPAGIGPEVILKSWLQRQERHLPPFMVLGDASYLAKLAEALGLDVTMRECSAEEATAVFPHALPVLSSADRVSAEPGKLSAKDANLVTGWIQTGVDLVMSGKASGLVTAPINKHALYEAGFEHPGHTEFLGALAKAHDPTARPVMMLAGPELRTVPVTIHIPLARVPDTLNSADIAATIWIAAHDLNKRFGIRKPRIAVAGLNPHAGENCSLGEEDMTTIEPAIAACRMQGIDVWGPLPADTMFHASARKSYDVAICMYHDQALIPAKTLAFDEAVNVTLGLPFIRTSPDHGTALDIAGKGVARPDSMIAAIRMAGEMAQREFESGNAGDGNQ